MKTHAPRRPKLPPLCPLGLAIVVAAHATLAAVAVTIAVGHHNPVYFGSFAAYLTLAGRVGWRWRCARQKLGQRHQDQ